jgi:protein-arginine kinase activator protein McsA
MSNDSLFKTKAFKLLEKAGDEERQRIDEARREKTKLVQEAVASGSESWQQDYQLHKNNPKAWFWVCTSCPRNYRQYRQRIKDAISKGDALIAQARGYQHNIQASLTHTLSYQLATDTMLAQVRNNILSLESERSRRASLINLILLTLTIGAGLLSLILTYVLREHRKENGQQVAENHVRPIMMLLDMVYGLVATFTDILFTLFAQPFHWLKANGYLKTYQITENRFTVASYGSVDNTGKAEKRMCQSCKKDISHKRSDAKFCSDKCRMDYHNYVPGRNGSNGLHG